MKFNLRKFLKKKLPENIRYLVILVLCSLILYGLLSLWDKYNGHRTSEGIDGAYSHNALFNEIAHANSKSILVNISLVIFPPGSSDQNSPTGTMLNIADMNIVIPTSTALEVSKFCLAGLDLVYKTQGAMLGFPDGTLAFDFEQPPTCYDLPLEFSEYPINEIEYRDYILDTGSEIVGTVIPLHNYYRYPFDDFSLDIALILDGFLSNNNNTTIIDLTSTPLLTLSNSWIDQLYTTSWEMYPSRLDNPTKFHYESSIYHESMDIEIDNAIQIRITRPRTIQVVFILTVLTIICFTLMLIFTNDLGTFIQGGVGVFFGLFSIRSVFTLPNIPAMTMVDLATQWIYIVFFLTTIIFLIKIKFWKTKKRKKPTNTE